MIYKHLLVCVCLVVAYESITIRAHFSHDIHASDDEHSGHPTITRTLSNKKSGLDLTYGVIVDCGSSGTRAHIYEWDSNLRYPELLHDIEPMRDNDGEPVSQSFKPSLSSLADSPDLAIEIYTKRVLDYVAKKIPDERHLYTGIYILATAGMRLLSDREQARIMSVMDAYVKRNYDFNKVKISVISGAHEGMYQWISVNAKLKRFLGDETSVKTKTFAVIEMGGASLQVTYQLRLGVPNMVSSWLPESVRDVYKAQIVEPQISHRENIDSTYIMHSTTFLGFGSNSAREAYLDLLIKKHYSNRQLRKLVVDVKHFFTNYFTNAKQNTSSSSSSHERDIMMLKDPCSPKGYVSDKLKKPKRMLETDDKILGFIADEDEESFSYRIQGTGNYVKCKRLVEEMLRLAKKERLNCKPDELCTMSLLGERFIPYKSLDFLGIGDIFYTTNTMLDMAGIYNHKRMVSKTKYICNTPYESLKIKYKDVMDNPKTADRIYSECFKAVWVDTFLMKGIRLPEDWGVLRTVGKINKDAPEWTLGAVLDKSLAIEEAADEIRQMEQDFDQLWPFIEDDDEDTEVNQASNTTPTMSEKPQEHE